MFQNDIIETVYSKSDGTFGTTRQLSEGPKTISTILKKPGYLESFIKRSEYMTAKDVPPADLNNEEEISLEAVENIDTSYPIEGNHSQSSEIMTDSNVKIQKSVAVVFFSEHQKQAIKDGNLDTKDIRPADLSLEIEGKNLFDGVTEMLINRLNKMGQCPGLLESKIIDIAKKVFSELKCTTLDDFLNIMEIVHDDKEDLLAKLDGLGVSYLTLYVKKIESDLCQAKNLGVGGKFQFDNELRAVCCYRKHRHNFKCTIGEYLTGILMGLCEDQDLMIKEFILEVNTEAKFY